MHRTLLVVACIATLSACSKKPAEAVEEKAAEPTAVQAAPAAQGDSSKSDAATAAFLHAIKVDFAAQFVATESEACGSVKGQEMPDLKSGSPMQYAASGVISWGKGSFDYVKEPGAAVVLTNSRAEKTFSFGVDIYDIPKGGRRYVAGLGQLKGASLSATVTDETKAVDGDAKLTTGNLCVGSAVPPLVTQGAWPLAAKYLQVPSTSMSCTPIGKFESQAIAFAFDGSAIQAGTNKFTQADSASAETLTIVPNGNTPSVTYSVTRADGTAVELGLSRPGALFYASLALPGGEHLICALK